jgi:hypothetical protein
MNRFSVSLAELVNDIDGLGGKYMTKWQSTKGRFRDMPKEIIWCNAEVFLESCAQFLEYLVVKPIYHIENVLLGKSEKKPILTYSHKL